MPQSFLTRALLTALLPVGLAAQSATIVDNARVRILSASDAPHRRTTLHKHDLNRVMIYLDTADQDISRPDGPTEHLHWKAGDVAWNPAGGLHISENVGPATLRIIEIEIKQPVPAAPSKRSPKLDPVAIDPSHNRLIFENPQVRVFRSTRDSGDREKWHEHAGAGRAVVLLTPLAARMETPDGRFTTMNGGIGDAFWSDGYIKHRGLNIGSAAAEMIIVEVK